MQFCRALLAANSQGRSELERQQHSACCHQQWLSLTMEGIGAGERTEMGSWWVAFLVDEILIASPACLPTYTAQPQIEDNGRSPGFRDGNRVPSVPSVIRPALFSMELTSPCNVGLSISLGISPHPYTSEAGSGHRWCARGTRCTRGGRRGTTTADQ